MRLRHVYLLLAVFGAIFPYWKLVPWVMDHGLNLSLLVHELFATRIGAFFGLDVIVSAIVLLVFIVTEGVECRYPFARSRSSLRVWSVSRSACRCSFVFANASSTTRRRVDLI